MNELIGKHRNYLVSALLILLTLAVYWQVLGHKFINYDDDEYVTGNVRVQSGLTLRGIAWALTTSAASNWHPLTWISHMADVQFHGLDPAGHHLTNLILHILNTLLLFLLLLRLTGSPPGNPESAFAGATDKSGIQSPKWARCVFVAALFAIHPLHVESVAWVAERKDVLSTLSLLLTILAYVRYVRKPGVARYLPVVVLFALGLMAKPMLVTLPFVLLLLDYWPLGRLSAVSSQQSASETNTGGSRSTSSSKRILLEKVPLLMLVVASCFVTLWAQRTAVEPIEHFSIGSRVANAIVAYAAYMVRMVWPGRLSVFYPHPGSVPVSHVLGSVVVLAAVTYGVIRLSSKRRYLAVGWLWYVITLLPVIGLIQVGWQGMADRYAYVPLIGLFLMVAWGVPDLLRTPETRNPKSVTPHSQTPILPHSHTPILSLAFAASIVLIVLSAVAWQQTGYWKDSVTLFRHALAVTENNAVAHNNLGLAYAAQGDLSRAVDHYIRALEIEPRWTDAHLGMGAALLNQGKIVGAISHLREVLSIDPDCAEAHNNIGLAYLQQQKLELAVDHLSRAVRLKPDYAMARNNLGIALSAQGKPDEAIAQFRQAVRIDPRQLNAYSNMGIELVEHGRIREAVACYRKVLQIQPNLPEAENDLAWILATQLKPNPRDITEAVRLAEKANKAVKYQVPGMLDTLAAAYASAGRFENAVKIAERGIDLATVQGDSDLASRLRERMENYRQHRALRIAPGG